MSKNARNWMHAQVTLLSRIANHLFSWLWIALVLVSFFFFLDVRFKVDSFISFKIQFRRTFDDLYCLYFKSEVMV